MAEAATSSIRRADVTLSPRMVEMAGSDVTLALLMAPDSTG